MYSNDDELNYGVFLWFLDGNCIVSGKGTNGPCRAMRANEPTVETLFKDVDHIPLAQFQLVVVLQLVNHAANQNHLPEV